MRFEVPAGVAFVTRRLRECGHKAYLVGGCVRDTLRGVAPHDYDVATDATPAQTLAAFADCRVIETGVKHGTVTVLADGEPVEVTTFRVDGAYADHRRPDAVTFTPSLEEDLARRDFTVNAMAWGEEGLVDPFGGQRDLARGVIACVGEPAKRFEEDGLRVMRALRFAATLDFTLDPETAAAVHEKAPLLDAISFERKWQELTKWLCGPAALPVLAAYRDVIDRLLPELIGKAADWARLPFLEPQKEPRLAAFLAPLAPEEAAAVLARFKCDGATRKRVLAALAHREDSLAGRSACLRLAHAVGFAAAGDVAALRGDAAAVAFLREAEANDAPITVSQLAITGDDLAALGVPRGAKMGALLETLLLAVIDGDLANERAVLLAAARKLV